MSAVVNQAPCGGSGVPLSVLGAVLDVPAHASVVLPGNGTETDQVPAPTLGVARILARSPRLSRSGNAWPGPLPGGVSGTGSSRVRASGAYPGASGRGCTTAQVYPLRTLVRVYPGCGGMRAELRLSALAVRGCAHLTWPHSAYPRGAEAPWCIRLVWSAAVQRAGVSRSAESVRAMSRPTAMPAPDAARMAACSSRAAVRRLPSALKAGLF
jgi:hypothetical protein